MGDGNFEGNADLPLGDRTIFENCFFGFKQFQPSKLTLPGKQECEHPGTLQPRIQEMENLGLVLTAFVGAGELFPSCQTRIKFLRPPGLAQGLSFPIAC